jgi:hypothetical protein
VVKISHLFFFYGLFSLLLGVETHLKKRYEQIQKIRVGTIGIGVNSHHDIGILLCIPE